MAKTIAEALRAEERVVSRRDTLLRLLRVRFGEVPEDVPEIIQQTEDAAQLDVWLERLVVAASLQEIGIQRSG